MAIIRRTIATQSRPPSPCGIKPPTSFSAFIIDKKPLHRTPDSCRGRDEIRNGTTVLAQNVQFTDFQLRLYQIRLGVAPKFGTIFTIF